MSQGIRVYLACELMVSIRIHGLDMFKAKVIWIRKKSSGLAVSRDASHIASKTVHSLWSAAWQFLRKVNIYYTFQESYS